MPLSKKDQYIQELEELAKRQYFETIEMKRAHIEHKNKYRNLTRCLNARRKEEEDDKRVARAKEPTTLRQAEIEREERLAKELDQIKRDEVKEKRLRQHLRENCHELKDLENKLKAAYISKELMTQVAEKEAMKMQEKIKEKDANELLQSAWVKEKEQRARRIQKEIDQKAHYKQELHDQMIREEQNKRFEYEEFLREKKMLDDIVQRMHDEDQRATEEQMCKMKKTQQEIEAFKAAQAVWRQKHKTELAEENRKIQEYLFSKASDAKAKQEEKDRKEAEKEKISDNIAKQMYEVQRQSREREEIISQLLEEEKKEEAEKRHKVEVEKELRQRVETLSSLTRQMKERQEQLRKQAEEDALYKEQLIAKIAEDERVEQLSNEKKRRKLLEVRKGVEQMMIERRQKKAEQMQLQMRMLEEEHRIAEERKRVIQEERIKMLQEHASNLIGYLPKGILRPDDLPYLRSDIVDRYGGKYKSSFANKSKE